MASSEGAWHDRIWHWVSEIRTDGYCYVASLVSIAVCSLVDDPYPPSRVVSPWLRHQLLCWDDGSEALFLGCAVEKQHHTCTLTFHSALRKITHSC